MGAFINDTTPEAGRRPAPRTPGRGPHDQHRQHEDRRPGRRADRRLRRPLRPHARRRLGGTRTGQPDRRAHRLQRAALCCRSPSTAAPTVAAGSPGRPHRAGGLRVPGRGTGPSNSISTPSRPDQRGRLVRVPAGRGLGAGACRHRGCPGFDLFVASDVPVGRRTVVLRRPGVRRRRGPVRSHRSRPGPRRTGRRRPACRERRGRRPHRHHGPVRLDARHRRIAPSSWTAATSAPRPVPLGLDGRRAGLPGHGHQGLARPRHRRLCRAPDLLRPGRAGHGRRRPARPRRSTDLSGAKRILDDETFRRVRHIVTENERVLGHRRDCSRPSGPAAIGGTAGRHPPLHARRLRDLLPGAGPGR